VNKGVVRSIRPPAHLKFTVALKEPDGSDRLENLTTLHLKRPTAALGYSCMCASSRKRPAAHDNIAGMEAGWNESIDRLVSQIGANG
jgi:hypothetical protein